MNRIFENFDVKRDGTIVRLKDNKVMKCCVDTEGYVKFSPRFNGEKVQKKVHRLVAIKYIPNPLNLPQINHIDGIKTNNNVDNLEWCNSKNNIQHAWNNGLSNNDHLKIKVHQVDVKTNKILNTFGSIREAAISIGTNETNIAQVIHQKIPKNRPKARQTAGGFKWIKCNDYPVME